MLRMPRKLAEPRSHEPIGPGLWDAHKVLSEGREGVRPDGPSSLGPGLSALFTELPLMPLLGNPEAGGHENRSGRESPDPL